jgi:hypothetical protein
MEPGRENRFASISHYQAPKLYDCKIEWAARTGHGAVAQAHEVQALRAQTKDRERSAGLAFAKRS